MSYESWIVVAIICFSIAALCLIAAIVMFFSFDIRTIRRELSGKQVENYMDEYRKKKEARKRVGIYDPSGKLIDVKKSNVGNSNVNFADAVAQSKAAAAVRTEADTQVLSNNNQQYADFRIIKDLVIAESAEYIG